LSIKPRTLGPGDRFASLQAAKFSEGLSPVHGTRPS
jgi:hypothetical protein